MVLTKGSDPLHAYIYRLRPGAEAHRPLGLDQNTETIDGGDPVELGAQRQDQGARTAQFRHHIDKVIIEFGCAHANLTTTGLCSCPSQASVCPFALDLPHLIRIIECSTNLAEIPKVGERRGLRDVDDPAHHQSHRFAIVGFQRSIEATEQLLKI